MSALRTFSYGGGVQSTAALVLAAQGKIDFPIFLFSNVGDDSEHPATLEYVNAIAKPYAQSQGVELHELRYTRRDGRQPTLYSEVVGDSRSVDIPMRVSNGMPGNRSCTADFKIGVVDKWLKAHGASKDAPAIIGLGISIDEYQRMRTDNPRSPFKTTAYPLIDLRLARQDCINVIERAGLPVPPKSSCWFCPFHRLTEWRRMKEHEPELFAASIALEQRVNEKRAGFGKDALWLTDKMIPLDRAVQHTQHEMDFEDACESGFCMT